MMNKRNDLRNLIIVLGIIIVIVILISSNSGFNRSSSSQDITSKLSEKGVGLIEIYGPIYDSRKWCKQIDELRNNSRVKSMVIRVDSPGGGIAASQELYEAVKRVKASKPVVVSMGGVAASGGYYCSLGADTIIANPGTTTGSIGVIIEIPQFYALMDKVGLGSEVIKSGEFKDAGSPTRKMTERDRKYFQGYVDDAYDQFINLVAEERGLPLEKVRELADGRVYTGRQAVEFGLVDLLGDQYEAIKIAGELAGLGSEPEIIKPIKKLKGLEWFDLMLDELEESVLSHFEAKSGFRFLWQTGGYYE